MQLETALNLVIFSVTSVVNDQEVIRFVVIEDKVYQGTIELHLGGFAEIVQFDNLSVVVEILAE